MCNKCNSKKINCECEESQFCGCPVKLPMECTNYTGVYLEPLGVEPGMDGNMVVKLINDYVKNFIDNLEIDPVSLTNIGGKVEIYKGLSNLFEHELRTLQGKNGIIVQVEQNPDESCDKGEYISIGIDLDWLDAYICDRMTECVGVPEPVHTVTTSNIVINLSNGAEYVFQANDFIDHFHDSYAPSHTLSEVQMNSNVTNISYQGNPYVAGTWVPITDVTSLKFTSPNQTGTYTAVIPWKGKDSLGNISTN